MATVRGYGCHQSIDTLEIFVPEGSPRNGPLASRESPIMDIYNCSVYSVDMTSMQEPTFAILTALAQGPRHGYAIITDAAELSGGNVRLQPGTLYAALDRLSGKGLVEVAGEEVVNGRLRRTYRLTGDGSVVLKAEARRRQALASSALSRLSASTPGIAL